MVGAGFSKVPATGLQKVLTIKFYYGSITLLPVRRGDLDLNWVYNVLDVVRVVGIAFRSEPLSCPAEAADTNCDGDVNVFDVVRLVDKVFRNGADPCVFGS